MQCTYCESHATSVTSSGRFLHMHLCVCSMGHACLFVPDMQPYGTAVPVLQLDEMHLVLHYLPPSHQGATKDMLMCGACLPCVGSRPSVRQLTKSCICLGLLAHERHCNISSVLLLAIAAAIVKLMACLKL